MGRTPGSVIGFLVVMLFSTIGMAEEYDFEIGLAYDRTKFDGAQTITTAGGTIFNSSEIDTDDLGVQGSWYFTGLSDDTGPRARAALVDRASSLAIGYLRTEQTSSTILVSDDPSFPIPPIDSQFESKGDSFTVDVRYVDRDSGWFGNAGLLTSDIALSGFVSDSFDASGWRLGFGKYLFATTTLGIDYSEVDLDGGGDASVLAVSLEHLGRLGERWQYAVDVDYSRLELDGISDTDSWVVTAALYPTRDFEFGIAVEEASGDLSFLDESSVRGFASWFVRPNIQLSARYQVDDTDFFGNVSIGGAPTVRDSDQYSFGLSASVRF